MENKPDEKKLALKLKPGDSKRLSTRQATYQQSGGPESCSSSDLLGDTRGSILARASQTDAQREDQRKKLVPLDGQDKIAAEYLWTELGGIYGVGWTGRWKDENSKIIGQRRWLKEIRRSGINSKAIDMTISKLSERPSDWGLELGFFIQTALQMKLKDRRQKEGPLLIETSDQAQARESKAKIEAEERGKNGLGKLKEIQAILRN